MQIQVKQKVGVTLSNRVFLMLAKGQPVSQEFVYIYHQGTNKVCKRTTRWGPRTVIVVCITGLVSCSESSTKKAWLSHGYFSVFLDCDFKVSNTFLAYISTFPVKFPQGKYAGL